MVFLPFAFFPFLVFFGNNLSFTFHARNIGEFFDSFLSFRDSTTVLHFESRFCHFGFQHVVLKNPRLLFLKLFVFLLLLIILFRDLKRTSHSAVFTCLSYTRVVIEPFHYRSSTEEIPVGRCTHASETAIVVPTAALFARRHTIFGRNCHRST